MKSETGLIINSGKRVKKAYMAINVILTFDTPNGFGDMQEFFDLYLPLSKQESCAVNFLHKKLFKRIVKKCAVYKRSSGDLIKISTAGNWDLFEEVTGHESLPELGHSCKWYFGNYRSDLDSWEKALVREFSFGTNVNISYIDRNWIEEVKLMITANESSLSRHNTTCKS